MQIELLFVLLHGVIVLPKVAVARARLTNRVQVPAVLLVRRPAKGSGRGGKDGWSVHYE